MFKIESDQKWYTAIVNNNLRKSR